MKYLFVLLTVFTISQSSICQENVGFKRKGKILVEVGYNALGGFNTGTGIGILDWMEKQFHQSGVMWGYS